MSEEQPTGDSVVLAEIRLYPGDMDLSMAWRREPMKILNHDMQLHVIETSIELLLAVRDLLKENEELFNDDIQRHRIPED